MYFFARSRERRCFARQDRERCSYQSQPLDPLRSDQFQLAATGENAHRSVRDAPFVPQERVPSRATFDLLLIASLLYSCLYFFLPPVLVVVGGGFFAPGLLGVRRLSAAVPLLGLPPIRGRNELKRRSLAAAAFLRALPPMLCDLLIL